MSNDNSNIQKKNGSSMKELSLDDLEIVSGGNSEVVAAENAKKMLNAEWYNK